MKFTRKSMTSKTLTFGFLAMAAAALTFNGCAGRSEKSQTYSTENGVGWFDRSERKPAAEGVKEYPWEVLGPNGETLLPNVYYAESSENQQIMPLSLSGHMQIDRLIYPTIGNPNLFVKSEPSHQLTYVLRLEEEAFQFLNPRYSPEPNKPQFFETLQLAPGQTGKDELGFYLVARKNRDVIDKKAPMPNREGIYRIQPEKIIVDRLSEFMPKEFKARRTLRVTFAHDALKSIPAGLYDIRFQAMKAGALVSVKSSAITEHQYNSVRVFDSMDFDKYTILNVTDSQVSGGALFSASTAKRLAEFKDFVNKSSPLRQNVGDVNPVIRRAAFITFNGDLHNGGAPAGTFSRFVARTYNSEAKFILFTLRDLDYPIFLTAGNHDGYAGTPAVPSTVVRYEDAFRKVTSGIDGIVGAVAENFSLALAELSGKVHLPLDLIIKKYSIEPGQSNWPGLNEAAVKAEQQVLADNPGGRAVNIVVGRHARVIPAGNASDANWLDQAWRNGWRQVEPNRRNMILFDGFHQWQKTYGPLYYSWAFGKNHYVNLNTYELRQHRRTGWGMYTVNYGGWMMPTQIDWAMRDMQRAQDKNRDIIMLTHHDPRGGHHGKDFPYYFKQVDFSGMKLSASNYLRGELIMKNFCKLAPPWAQNLTTDLALGCMHDGLQEWMRPDPKYDCTPDNVNPQSADLECDPAKMKTASAWYSGYEMVSVLAGEAKKNYTRFPNLRTLLMGHTHFNSLEIAQAGDALVPDKLQVDAGAKDRLAQLDTANPVRAQSIAKEHGDANMANPEAPVSLDRSYIEKNDYGFVLDVDKQYGLQRILQPSRQGGKRELAIMRMTAISKLTRQTYVHQTVSLATRSETMFGFAAFDIEPARDSRNYQLPQINRVHYFINHDGYFDPAGEAVALPREKRIDLAGQENPLTGRFLK